MRPSQTYKELLKAFNLVLKEHGFSRKGNSFHVLRQGNWGLINFQKSRKSNAFTIIFTINIGVCSKKLLKFFTTEQVDKPPSIEDCQWRERLGFLLSEQQDKWWTVDNKITLDNLVEEIRNLLYEIAIPIIERYIHDERLRDLWLTGKSPGLTDVQRLLNLSVLLRAVGPVDRLKPVLEELAKISEGKPSAFRVRQHINGLQKESMQ